MSQKSSFYRIFEIIKMLNEGKKLCINSLSIHYDVSERTIRRDFELIKELFGDFLSKQGDCYNAYEKTLLDNVLSAQDLVTLATIVNLFGEMNKKTNISTKIKKLINTSTNIYDFKSKPFENLKNKNIIKNLEHAIKFNKEIRFNYKIERSLLKRVFNPYKILFLNENFYLIGENLQDSRSEFLRVSFIQDIEVTKKVFHLQKDIIDFIEKVQTPWSTFGVKDITVRIRIEKKIRRYFYQKKYLPSQKFIQAFKNGDIEIEYKITNYREIEELLTKWLPNIKILEPLEFKRKLKTSLRKKLGSL